MPTETLADLARKMADIDFAMLVTRTEGDRLASRPMSNNGEVDARGDSWYFALGSTRTVADIERHPQVGLTFQGKGDGSGAPPPFIAIEGEAELLRERDAFVAHWNPDLERWFEDGVDTEDLVLIRVRASRAHYWDGEGDGEIVV